MSWQCGACTLSNGAESSRCEACGAGRFAGAVDVRRFDAADRWACLRCSFANDAQASRCQVCHFVRISRPPSASGTWACAACTIENDASISVCSVCATAKDPSHVAANGDDFAATEADAGEVGGVDLNRSFHRQTSESMEKRREQDEDDARQALERIRQFCKSEQHEFVDDQFRPCAASVGELDDADVVAPSSRLPADQLVWLRPAHIRTRDGRRLRWAVFRQPQPADIVQGALGNCWFLSALAVVAERADLLDRVLVTRDYSAEGVYQLRLCVDGYWRTVTVDDHLPCHPLAHSLVFSEARRNQVRLAAYLCRRGSAQLWVPLIEKALAKVYGNYACLSGGQVIEGLAVLTGAACEHLPLQQSACGDDADGHAFDADLTWARLLSGREARFLMGASCGAGAAQMLDDAVFEGVGLLARHAYSLLQVHEVDGRRFVKLRNPWGQFEWTGAWSNTSDLWTPAMRDILLPDGIQPGVFCMLYDEFCQYFDSVDICKVRDGWSEIRWSLRLPPDATAAKFCATRLIVTETSELSVTLHQEGFRHKRRRKHGELDLCVLLAPDRRHGGGARPTVEGSERRVAAFVCVDALLQPGVYWLLGVALNHWGVRLSAEEQPRALLAVQSARPLVVEAAVEAPPTLLADALIGLAMARGRRQGVEPSATPVFLTSHFAGLLVVFENRSARHAVRVRCDCSESVNVVSSRAALHVTDCVPPLHRQVLLVLTHLEATQSYSLVHRLSYVASAVMTEHAPAIDERVHGLHSPRPITD